MESVLPGPIPTSGDKSEVWDRILRTALSLPGAKIDRASFLRKALSPHFSEEVVEKAIATRPALAGITSSQIRPIAASSIAWHRSGVTAVSFATGIPGGWWIAGTIPADMTQFFWHVTIILQKLAFLYGWPSLADKDRELDDETLHIFTIFIGVMFGAGAASKILGEVSEKAATQVANRLQREALTKYGTYQVAKEVSKWLGIKLTKEKFANVLAKAVPVVSGFLSGAMTWITFGKMSKKLRKHLEELRLAKVAE
jgi:hypothetical protein